MRELHVKFYVLKFRKTFYLNPFQNLKVPDCQDNYSSITQQLNL
jgi:hypothetical protein